jgi:hypothetical protein
MKHALILTCVLLGACTAPMIEQRIPAPKQKLKMVSHYSGATLRADDLALIAMNGCAV